MPQGLLSDVTDSNVSGMAKSPAEIIEAKGGAAVFAAAVGKTPTAVRVWKFRNRFPRSAWPEITAAYPELSQAALKRVEQSA